MKLNCILLPIILLNGFSIYAETNITDQDMIILTTHEDLYRIEPFDVSDYSKKSYSGLESVFVHKVFEKDDIPSEWNNTTTGRSRVYQLSSGETDCTLKLYLKDGKKMDNENPMKMLGKNITIKRIYNNDNEIEKSIYKVGTF